MGLWCLVKQIIIENKAADWDKGRNMNHGESDSGLIPIY